MRALEFKSKIKDNQITIPEKIKLKLKNRQDKEVRVIVLIDDKEDLVFENVTTEHFLEGYAESDSVYDNYQK